MIVVAGEALIDLVEQDGVLHPLPGGSPCNVAVGLARLGEPAAYLGRLAEDGFGRLLSQRLTREGVGVELVTATADPTTLAVVHLDEQGGASYRFYLAGTSAAGLTRHDLGELPEGAALHLSLGALGLSTRPAGESYRTLLERERGRRLVSLDPNVRASALGDHATEVARLEEAVASCDLVKASDEDLRTLYPDRDPVDVAARWRRLGPALVVVTHGDRGATAIGTRADVEAPAESVEVIDTVGAGDAFTAGLLAWLCSHATAGVPRRAELESLGVGELVGALGHAVHVAALTCARRGADPPSLDEL